MQTFKQNRQEGIVDTYHPLFPHKHHKHVHFNCYICSQLVPRTKWTAEDKLVTTTEDQIVANNRHKRSTYVSFSNNITHISATKLNKLSNSTYCVTNS